MNVLDFKYNGTQIEKVFINPDAKFLGDVMSDLPHNCLFNKGITGCGGTTIALTNNENYVVCVPYTSLIQNKLNRDTIGVGNVNGVEVFGLFGSFYERKSYEESFINYLRTSGVKKIMCTYDKLQWLASYLKSANLSAKDFRLVVDEYHCLLGAYGYRDKAIEGVLTSFESYKSYCFMSATPIPMGFVPTELENVRNIEAVWECKNTLKVDLMERPKPYVAASKCIKIMQKNGVFAYKNIVSKHLFFFINSVRDINSILENCNLKNEDVKIIVADGEENRNKLEDYTISTADDKRDVPFTFITRKAFEGVDFFAEDGLCVVLSNTHNTNTLLDVATTIYQIAGRIRNTRYNDFVLHIFNTKGSKKMNLEVTAEEYKKALIKKFDNGVKMLEALMANNSTNEDIEEAIKDYKLGMYMVQDKEGNWGINKFLFKYDYFTFLTQQKVYTDGITVKQNFEANGCDITAYNYTNNFDEEFANINRVMSFKDAYLAYSEGATKEGWVNSVEAQDILNAQPLVKDAYYKLGDAKVRTTNYRKVNVEALLSNLDNDKKLEVKVAELLQARLTTGFVPSKKLKALFAEIYEMLGVDKKAKASDITNYYEATECGIRIDGVKTKGYKVLTPKIMVKPALKEEVIVEGNKQTKVDWDAINYNEMLDELYDDKDENAA